MVELVMLQADGGPPMAYVLTAIAAIIGGLGIPKLWPYLFNGGKTECEKQLIRLSSQVAILFMVMRDKFEDEPRILEGIDDITNFINDLNK